MILLTFDWKSSIPALKKSSLSDCKAFAVKATIGVFTPKARSCRVAYETMNFMLTYLISLVRTHVQLTHTHTQCTQMMQAQIYAHIPI